MQLMKVMVDPSLDLLWSHQQVKFSQQERAQLRHEEEKVRKQIWTEPSQGDDLNIKGLRGSLGRIDVVCRYFCKNDCAAKKRGRLCYAITDFNQKSDPPP